MSSAKTAPGVVNGSRKGVSARRIRAVHRRLRKLQGPFKPKPQVPVIDELVGTLLSQHTSDTNTARAFAGLKTRFPTWEEVRSAPTEEVADAIRAGGLADQKAPRIKAILTEIEEREGALDLSRLQNLPDEEVGDYLCSLPGVGPKTAACVLVFSMGRSAFPIDTHVHRVARRLGWIEDRVTAEAAGRELGPKVPAELRYSLHMALIDHGRKVCKARNPRCTQCVLFDLCDSGPRLLAAGDAI
ncbi:MAG: endonuclease III [Actinomycetota bacterium]|nr:endonuclease III [Actinomycetota bacterium]